MTTEPTLAEDLYQLSGSHAADLTVPTPPVAPMDLDDRERAAFAAAAEPSPEPESGPGWRRDQIQQVREDLEDAQCPKNAAAVRALLTERDQLVSILAEIGDDMSPTGERPEEALGTLAADVRTVLAERAAARAELAEVTADRDQLREESRRFAAELEFGDGVNEPAASLADMLDPIKEAMSAAADHNECPVHCELCGETLAATVCQRCKGIGDIGGGGYSECPECAGAGRIHEGCAEASYADLVATADRLRGERDNLEVQVRAYVKLLDAIAEAAPGATDPIAVVHRLRAERDKALRLVAMRDSEANAHEGEVGDMRAQLSAAEAETDRLRGELEQARAQRDFAHELRDRAAAVRKHALETARRDGVAVGLDRAAEIVFEQQDCDAAVRRIKEVAAEASIEPATTDLPTEGE